jgi:hypothetical protein
MDGISRLVRALALVVIVFVCTSHTILAAGSASPDDTAKFLAGMQPPADSPLAPLTRDPSWQRYAHFFDSAWTSLDQRQLAKVRGWASANLTNPKPVLYYMFSGPDFLYANAFFPHASTYVLSGLEPAGTIPDVTALAPRAVSAELGAVGASMRSILSVSFFITKNMRVQLTRHRLAGTLPILYVFLARSGLTIREVSLVAIDNDGVVHPGGEAGLAKNAPNGAKIVFSNGDGPAQTLYYFQTDVSNLGANSNGFLKFCEGLGQGDGLVKSASYLMHSDNFSAVRNFLLKQSAAIVQDDTGIPVRFFDAHDWELHPFGRYLGPIGIFRGHYQQGLSGLFMKAKPGNLDFGIGYRGRLHESNLLLAVKTGARAALNE